MRFSGKTEEKLFWDSTGLDENMTIPMSKEKSNKFSFMFGAFNDGIRLVLKGQKLINDNDETMIKFQRALFNKYEVNFEHWRMLGNLELTAEFIKSYTNINFIEKQ